MFFEFGGQLFCVEAIAAITRAGELELRICYHDNYPGHNNCFPFIYKTNQEREIAFDALKAIFRKGSLLIF